MVSKYLSIDIPDEKHKGITLKEFAYQNNKTKSQMKTLLENGRILGAQRLHNGRWRIYPPAKIIQA